MMIKKTVKACCFSALYFSVILFSALAFASSSTASSTKSTGHLAKTEFVELVIGHDKQIKFLLDGQEISLASLVDKMNAASDARHAEKAKKKLNPEVRMIVDKLPEKQNILNRELAERNDNFGH